MLRQRLRSRTSSVAYIGRALLVLIALALLWYGLMLVLLAAKASPDFVNAISGYRSAYDALAGLTREDITDVTRLVAAPVGLAAFLFFGYLALKEIPRPYLARADLRLHEDERGTVDLKPRAIERVAEVAAAGHPAVSSVTSRYATDDLAVEVNMRRARGLAEALGDVHDRVLHALQMHGLPPTTVDVVLTGFDRQQRRELS